MIVYAFPWWMLPFVWTAQAFVWAFVWMLRLLTLAVVIVAVALGRLALWLWYEITDRRAYRPSDTMIESSNQVYDPSEAPTETLKWPGEK